MALLFREGLSAFITYSGREGPSEADQFWGLPEVTLSCLLSGLRSFLQDGMFLSQKTYTAGEGRAGQIAFYLVGYRDQILVSGLVGSPCIYLQNSFLAHFCCCFCFKHFIIVHLCVGTCVCALVCRHKQRSETNFVESVHYSCLNVASGDPIQANRRHEFASDEKSFPPLYFESKSCYVALSGRPRLDPLAFPSSLPPEGRDN